MVQTPERGRPLNGENRPEVAKKRPVKKSYISPQLLEYGSITKLTQNASGPVNDIGGMMQDCL